MALLLGLDVGTTKSACVVVDSATRALVACESAAHGAALEPGVQDAAKHIAVMRQLIAKLPADLREKVAAVGVTGQMHGVVAWAEAKTLPLLTWQSTTRDLAEFQQIVPALRHGFGVASLAQLAKDGALEGCRYAATIHDFLVWQLTGCPERVVMDYSDAASWGAYDLRANRFDGAAWERLGIPAELMPEVVPCGSRAGSLDAGWGLPAGIPVMAALGDNQASVFATAECPENEIYLTLGTGAQLSVVVKAPVDTVECRPYPGGRFLAVAAPLCGGAAWAWLHAHVKAWLAALGMPALSDRELYDRIDALALTAMDDADLPTVRPQFLGERHDPALRGAIEGLDLTNYTPGKLAAALALGVVGNLQRTLPEEFRRGRGWLLVSGNAIRRTRALQAACVKCFGLEPIPAEGNEEAARGAAYLSGGLLS